MRFPRFFDSSRPTNIVQPDAELVAAARLGDELRENNFGRPRRIQKWGDKKTITNMQGFGDAFISIGPFEEPEEIRICIALDPRATPSYKPKLAYRIVRAVGNASIQEDSLELPRTLSAQSLDLYAREQDITSGAQVINIWAERHRPGMQPVPIGFTNYTMGIGVANLEMDPPPRETTHLMVGKGSSSAIVMSVRVTMPGGAAQEFNVNTTGASAVLVNSGILPVAHDAVTWTLLRSATAALDVYTVWYLRA